MSNVFDWLFIAWIFAISLIMVQQYQRFNEIKARAVWVQESTEAERVRVLGPVAQRSLDARAGE